MPQTIQPAPSPVDPSPLSGLGPRYRPAEVHDLNSARAGRDAAPGEKADALRMAVGLLISGDSDPETAAAAVGLEGNINYGRLRDLAKKHYKEILAAEPAYLARMAYAAMVLSVGQVLRAVSSGDLQPGQVAQSIKYLNDMHDRFGGSGTIETNIEVVFDVGSDSSPVPPTAESA